MKTKMTLALGIALGSGLYDLLSKGIRGIDFYEVGFTFIFGALCLLLVPDRFLTKKKKPKLDQTK